MFAVSKHLVSHNQDGYHSNLSGNGSVLRSNLRTYRRFGMVKVASNILTIVTILVISLAGPVLYLVLQH